MAQCNIYALWLLVNGHPQYNRIAQNIIALGGNLLYGTVALYQPEPFGINLRPKWETLKAQYAAADFPLFYLCNALCMH